MVCSTNLPNWECEHLQKIARKAPAFDTSPWVGGPPLSRCRVALISTAGLHRREDPPFRSNDGVTGYRMISGESPGSDLVMRHLSVNFDRAGFRQDINLVLPLDRFTAIACLILGMGLPTVAAYVVLASIVPPVLKKMGVDVFPAHMFIFYFAILAGITPPVCTAAYCAAGIADSNPMKTGLTASRLGFVCFLLPFAFVYDPAILGQGTASQIAIAIFFTTLSVFAWAAFVEGYFFTGKLHVVQQILMGCCSIALIHPNYLVSFLGLIIALITLFVPKLISLRRS